MLRRFVILLAVGAAIALVLLPWVAVAQNYVVDDTATTTIPENSFGPARMSTNKVLYGMPATSSGTALYPSAFASADAIAAQTATFIHGGLMGWNGSSWDRLQVDGSKNLKVAVQGTVTVTANAGTNLNTSALALEAGNLLTVANNTGSLAGTIGAVGGAKLPICNGP